MNKGRRSTDDIEADLGRLRKWLARPRTMDGLAARFKVGPRTILRWFKALAAQGHQVSRVGLDRPTRYQIAP